MPISLRVIWRYKPQVIAPIITAIRVMSFSQSNPRGNGAT